MIGKATLFYGQKKKKKALRCGYNPTKKPAYAKSHWEPLSCSFKYQALNIWKYTINIQQGSLSIEVNKNTAWH